MKRSVMNVRNSVLLVCIATGLPKAARFARNAERQSTASLSKALNIGSLVLDMTKSRNAMLSHKVFEQVLGVSEPDSRESVAIPPSATDDWIHRRRRNRHTNRRHKRVSVAHPLDAFVSIYFDYLCIYC